MQFFARSRQSSSRALDVVLYAAQANALIVAELVKKGAFLTETKGSAVAANQGYKGIRDLPLPVAAPSVLAVCR